MTRTHALDERAVQLSPICASAAINDDPSGHTAVIQETRKGRGGDVVARRRWHHGFDLSEAAGWQEWRVPCAIKKMKGRLTKEQMTEFVREGQP